VICADRSGRALTKPPRVLFAIGGLGTGGSEHQVVEMITRLHPDEVDGVVMTFGPPQGMPNERRLSEAGVKHVWLDCYDGPRLLHPLVALARSARVIREVRPDLIYAWLEEASLYTSAVAHAQRIPLIVSRRNVCGASMERMPLVGWAVRRAERSAGVVTGNSQAVLDEARRRSVPAERLRLVRNGHPPVEALPPPAGDTVRLGYVAAFRPEKGHFRLLDALRHVRASVPWQIDLAGDGPLLPAVREAADTLGLSESLRFIGVTRDVRSFWRDRHVAVLLSDHEGSPNALIEAAFAGRPAVATDVGGIPEVVAPAGGLLAPLGDPQAVAAALERIIDDGALRERMGISAHHQAEERFSIQQALRGHLEAIREGLGLPADQELIPDLSALGRRGST
jgi:glycosyltransferase involved in cell wall biosynthesis